MAHHIHGTGGQLARQIRQLPWAPPPHPHPCLLPPTPTSYDGPTPPAPGAQHCFVLSASHHDCQRAPSLPPASLASPCPTKALHAFIATSTIVTSDGLASTAEASSSWHSTTACLRRSASALWTGPSQHRTAQYSMCAGWKTLLQCTHTSTRIRDAPLLVPGGHTRVQERAREGLMAHTKRLSSKSGVKSGWRGSGMQAQHVWCMGTSP